MRKLPLILIAGWGHTGEAMRHLQATLAEYSIEVTSTAELWQTQSAVVMPPASGLSRYAQGLRSRLMPFGGRVGVIGWSMGGIIALETLRADPALLQRLVIIGGTARFCSEADEPAGVNIAVLRAMALGLRRAPGDLFAAYYAQVHAPQLDPESAELSTNRFFMQLDRDELRQGLDYLQDIDLRDNLDKQTIPTLVLHGQKDRIVPWQAGEWLSRRLPASNWRAYADYGHGLPIHAPLLVADDIRAFLEDGP